MAELLDLANCRQVEGPVWCVVVCRKQLAYVAVAAGPTSLCRRFLHRLGKEHDMRSSVAKRGPLYLVRMQGGYYVVYNACVPDLEYRAAESEQERLLLKLMDSSLAVWALLGVAAVSLTALAAAGVYAVKASDGSTSIVKQVANKSAVVKPQTPPPFNKEFFEFWARVVAKAPRLDVPSAAPNQNAIRNYINNTCKSQVSLQILLEGIVHVPFDTFKEKLQDVVNKLDYQKSYTLCLYSNDGGVLNVAAMDKYAPGTKPFDDGDHRLAVFCAKSNFWVSALVYDLMTTKGYTVNISTDFDQNNSVLLLCDDALYSGNQMYYTLDYYTQFDNKICVLVPYCSAEAQKKLIGQKFKQVELVIGETMRNYRTIIEEGLKLHNSQLTVDDVITQMRALIPGAIQPQLNWYYFDHKWPDGESFVLMQGIDQGTLFEFGCAVQHIPDQKVFMEPTPPYRALCNA
jgi:hypothetical protein